MPNIIEDFQTTGPSWQERAEKLNGFQAVYSPSNKRLSLWLSLITSRCLEIGLRYVKSTDRVIDFGCGIGYHTQIIQKHAGFTIGVDITPGMIERARTSYGHLPIVFEQIDGIHLPVENNSIDMIWVSSVLKYSLLVPDPKHREIVDEFDRVLKPGGWVYNFEMYVDQPSTTFSKDFIEGGFSFGSATVAHIYQSLFDKLAMGKYRRIFLRKWWADLSILYTRHFINKDKLQNRLRDYFFEYQKL